MADSTFDPGFTRKYDGPLARVIRRDGSFNVRRSGGRLSDIHLYQIMIRLPWPVFIGVLAAGYVLINAAFAILYIAAGPGNLVGADIRTPWNAFLSAFFFSTHTFTTVGYGTIAPSGFWTNIIASTEAMVGLMGFAVATGLLYGRFSRGSARLVFSDRMVVAPHRGGGDALMFRVANRRISTLMELEAKLLLMTVVPGDGQPVRKYELLRLEVPSVYFLPLTWTLVHPLDASSPLRGKGKEELAALQAEILVLIKGYDDRFHQTVYARSSYRHDEITWGERFSPAFHADAAGETVLDLRRISETAPAPLAGVPEPSAIP